jgi:Restriction alleviation protein Lar
MSAATPVPCPHCGRFPTIERDGQVTIYCRDCYDGPGSLIGSDGWGRETIAVESWNDKVEQWTAENTPEST